MPPVHPRPNASSPPPMVVLGAGATGLSCVRHLHARGVPVRIADTRAQPPAAATLSEEFPQVPRHFGTWPAQLWDGVEEMVLSPGLDPADPVLAPARARNITLLGDVELFARAARRPVLAVTGTNGKSTVTSLTAGLAQAAGCNARAGGNLGPPALELLEGPEPDCYVLELSSFQLELTHSLRATGAAVLNLTPDHLDRHGTLAAYAAAKARVLRGAGTAVLARDDAGVAAMATGLEPTQRQVWFGLGAPAGAQDFGVLDSSRGPQLARGEQPLLAVAELPLAGAHNVLNALAALALVATLELPLPAAAAGLRTAQGLPHRMTPLGRVRGLDWYDDSKGTNVGATAAALEGLAGIYPGGHIVLIAGGVPKGQDFAPLRPAVARHVRAVVLIGEAAPAMGRTLDGAAPLIQVPDMQAAVAAAAALGAPGDVVLLSPACASFDMFRDYHHRGQVFAAAVAALREVAHG